MGYYDGNGVMPKAGFPLAGTEAIVGSTNLSNGRSPQDEQISVDQLKGYSRAVVSLTDAATITSDASLMNAGLAAVVLGGNRTLANPTNLQPGQDWRIRVTQDNTGGRTLAFGTAYKQNGGSVTLSAGANAVDILHFTTDGTTVYVEAQGKAYA